MRRRREPPALNSAGAHVLRQIQNRAREPRALPLEGTERTLAEAGLVRLAGNGFLTITDAGDAALHQRRRAHV